MLLDTPMYYACLKKATATYKTKKKKKKNEIYKMPAMHFPLLFHSCSLPRLLSIAPSHRSMTERGRRVLHQMSDCISLSAGKARDLKGTVLPPYFTCRVVTHISTHRKTVSKKKKNTTAAEQGRTSFITCWDKIRNQLKQRQVCMGVIVSPAQYQRVVCCTVCQSFGSL